MVVICPVPGQMQVGTMKLCPESGPLHYTARGESIEDNAPELEDHGEYLKMSANADEEYSYLFTTDGEWICYNMNPQ